MKRMLNVFTTVLNLSHNKDLPYEWPYERMAIVLVFPCYPLLKCKL